MHLQIFVFQGDLVFSLSYYPKKHIGTQQLKHYYVFLSPTHIKMNYMNVQCQRPYSY